MSQISTVLFDLGNVLINIDFSAFWRNLGFLRPEEIVPLMDEYKTFTSQYETGQITTENYLNNLRGILNNRYPVDQIEKAFGSIIQKPVAGTADIVNRVSQKHQIALVSNTNEIHHKLTMAQFDVIRNFKRQYLSYKIHTMKPARGFYDAIIKDLNIYPSRMLFIDDVSENVKAAKIAGMNAMKFEGSAQLEEMLKIHGVL